MADSIQLMGYIGELPSSQTCKGVGSARWSESVLQVSFGLPGEHRAWRNFRVEPRTSMLVLGDRLTSSANDQAAGTLRRPGAFLTGAAGFFRICPRPEAFASSERAAA